VIWTFDLDAAASVILIALLCVLAAVARGFLIAGEFVLLSSELITIADANCSIAFLPAVEAFVGCEGRAVAVWNLMAGLLGIEVASAPGEG
jgi:hypothetical protein